MDVIEDAELAIESYLTEKFSEDSGVFYLIVYGLLQALSIQQAAAFHLCESLEIQESIDKYPNLIKIRDIRHDSIGHPTKRDRGKKQKGVVSYHFISRSTLSPYGFQLISDYSNGKYQFRNISIPDLIAEQKKCLIQILNHVIKNLQEEEMIHKKKFQGEKLITIFKHINYAMEKIRTLDIMGKWGLDTVEATLSNFKDALGKRQEPFGDSLKYIYDLLNYPIKELKMYFNGTGNPPNINKQTAYIFAFFIDKHMEELKQIAKEIDGDYLTQTERKTQRSKKHSKIIIIQKNI